jgi:integrase
MQLPQFSIHGLRHTHATILLLKGENIKVISERLGHKSTQITWDTYSHVLPSMKKQTADLLDNIFDDL